MGIQRVSAPEQVKLLLHSRVQRVLGCFLAAEQTVSGAARVLKLDLRIVHRDVQALEKVALLRVAKRQARSGRAVAHYRASASAYFVPQSLHPDADYLENLQRQFGPFDAMLNAALAREFERALKDSGNREWGTRLFVGEEGPDVDQCFYDAELRGVLTGWQGPQTLATTGAIITWLTAEEALEIEHQFFALYFRLAALGKANRALNQGRPWGIRAIMTPITEDDAALRRF